MPRLSNFEKAKNQALDVLKTIKLDKKDRNRYETSIISAQRIDKVQRIIDELNALKTGTTAQVFRQQQQALVIDKRLKKIDEIKKQEVINSVIDQSIITITFDNIRKYEFITHGIEIRRMKTKQPNKLYSHQVIYYDGNTAIKKNIIFYKSNEVNDQFINKVIMRNTGEDYEWAPKKWVKYNKYNSVKIITSAHTPLEPRIYNTVFESQIYRLNDTGTCVYDAFVNFFKNKSNERNAKTVYNKLINLKEQYAKAYTDETIHEIGKLCKTTIQIVDLVNGNDKFYNDQNTNKYRIQLINSRYNHLELLIDPNNYVEVEKKQYDQIKIDTDFYIERMGSLITPSQTYKCISDDFRKVYNDWKQSNNYDSYFIYGNSKHYQFIKNYDYTLHTFFDDSMIVDNNLYSEVDQKKSYYNCTIKENNKYYVGFPSGSFITVSNISNDDFKILTNNNLIGFFECVVSDYHDKSYTSIKLGFTIGSIHILTTVQIILLQKYIKFDFINGCYSPSVDIPFNERFLNKIDGKISYYSKAFGLMLHQTNMIETHIKPYTNDIQYYNIINNDKKEMYKLDNGLIKIIDHVEESKSYVHIAYFMNSYCKTYNLELMYNNNIDNIVGVKVDSVVYLKDTVLNYDTNVFRPKETNIEFLKEESDYNFDDLDYGLEEIENIKMFSYFRNYFIEKYNDIIFNKSFLQTQEIINNRVLFIGGKGGSGKTHSVLNSDINRKNIIYTSNCWNLIQGMKQKCNNEIIGMSHQRLLGDKTEKFRSNNIKYIVVDELTLIDETIVKKLIKTFYWCYIFLIGDVEKDGYFYQCSMPTTDVIIPNKINCQYITYIKSYRFNEELNNKLDDLRQFMKLNDNKVNKNYLLKNYIYQNFSNCLKNKNDIIFNDDDIGISATDEMGESSYNLTEFFINRGAKPQYFIKKTDLYNARLKGQQLKEKPNHENYEMKLFKTIHSFQGLDLTQTNKIIIAINFNFDYNLFYTALSRARRLDQINIIMNV